jgi:DNA-binding Xre family transcriptional regulator
VPQPETTAPENLDELEQFTAEELFAAAGETSPQYEGIVLAQAFEIVRHELRMTQRELARELGIGGSTISRLMSGNYASTNLEKLASWYERLAVRRPAWRTR